MAGNMHAHVHDSQVNYFTELTLTESSSSCCMALLLRNTKSCGARRIKPLYGKTIIFVLTTRCLVSGHVTPVCNWLFYCNWSTCCFNITHVNVYTSTVRSGKLRSLFYMQWKTKSLPTYCKFKSWCYHSCFRERGVMHTEQQSPINSLVIVSMVY